MLCKSFSERMSQISQRPFSDYAFKNTQLYGDGGGTAYESGEMIVWMLSFASKRVGRNILDELEIMFENDENKAHDFVLSSNCDYRIFARKL